MTPKDRILKTINGETPDRIPWAPFLSYYFLNVQKKWLRDLGEIGACKKLNIDIIAKDTVSTYKSKSKNVITKTFINGKEINIPEEKNNWQQEVFRMFSLYKYRNPSIKIIEKYIETPIGVLKSSYESFSTSKTVFQKEFFIKEKKDLKILEYMYKDLEFIPNYDEVKKEETLIGEDGIVIAGVRGSPIIDLIELFTGPEKFIFFLNDYRREMESLYNIILAKHIETYKIAAKSSCPVLQAWEDTGTGLYSPKIFRKYIVKALKECANIAHKFGKTMFVHSCGSLNDIIDDLLATDLDGLTDICPFPTGNISLLDLRKRVGKNIIITGGIDSTVMVTSDKKYLEKVIIKTINDMKLYGKFILGSADTVPANTPLENLKLIYELVKEYGYYK